MKPARRRHLAGTGFLLYGTALVTAVRREALPARQMLLQAGQVARHLYFVQSGLVRSYALHEGREVSSWFVREGEFVISVVSFLTQTPSAEYLELLEASVVYVISYEQLQQLYLQFPEFNFFGRVLTERYYVLSEQRAYQLRALPAASRYAQLLRDFPAVLQRVFSKHIATHLGMTDPRNAKSAARQESIIRKNSTQK